MSRWLHSRTNRHCSRLLPMTAKAIALRYAAFFENFCDIDCKNLINKRHGSWCWLRQHHGQTIHPIENFIPMNLFKNLCVVTWPTVFWKASILSGYSFNEFLVCCPTVPKCAVAVWCLASNSLHGGQKCSPINEISLHISNSRTKPAGLDF